MKSVRRHTGILNVLERLPSSINGNPRYLVEVDGYQARTAVDSSWGYSVNNFNGKKVSCDIGLHYGVSTIENIKAA